MTKQNDDAPRANDDEITRVSAEIASHLSALGIALTGRELIGQAQTGTAVVDMPEAQGRLRADGRLGGYLWGVHRKSWLLDHEAANRSAPEPAGLLLRGSP